MGRIAVGFWLLPFSALVSVIIVCAFVLRRIVAMHSNGQRLFVVLTIAIHSRLLVAVVFAFVAFDLVVISNFCCYCCCYCCCHCCCYCC